MSHAQPAADPAAAAAVKSEIDRAIARYRIPGIQYTLVDRHGVRFEYQAGFADLGSEKPVLPETTFMASSSTKVVTAAAILQLIEKQKVSLESPLSVYYPQHPYGERVTVRHLLTQTSGIPNPLPLRWLHLAEKHGFDEESALQQVLQRHSKLRWAPGEHYGYSNISYWLLGRVIESASGRRYAEYVDEKIFRPLGVTPASASFEIQNPTLHATGYQRRFSMLGLFLCLLMDRRMIGGGSHGHTALLPVYMNGPAYGGLICTATGLALFLQDLLRQTPRLFSSSTRDLFLATQSAPLGWRLGQLKGQTYLGKPGGGPGFRSNVRIYLRSGLGVAWLGNETGTSEPQMNALSDAVDRHWLRSGTRTKLKVLKSIPVLCSENLWSL